MEIISTRSPFFALGCPPSEWLQTYDVDFNWKALPNFRKLRNHCLPSISHEWRLNVRKKFLLQKSRQALEWAAQGGG